MPRKLKQREETQSEQTLSIHPSQLPFMFSGKRLLRNEMKLSNDEFQTMLNAGFLQSVPSLIKTFLFYKCQRCGNTRFSQIGMIQCSTCRISHPYCRKCIQMGRMMACNPLFEWTGPEPSWTSWQTPLLWNGQLTALQQMASDRIVEVIEKGTGELLIWAVCGAGKTEMLFEGIAKCLMLGKRICLATPRTDVVKELLPRFKAAFPKVEIEGLYGGSRDKFAKAQFILATTHQLLRFYKAFDCLIIDEVDAFPFHKEPMLQYAAKQAVKDAHTLIYLTATPRQELVLRTKTNAIPHHFIPSRFHGHPLPIPKPIMSYDLQRNLKKHTPPRRFVNWLSIRENKMRQLLIFVPTIALAEKLHQHLIDILKKNQVIKEDTELAFVHAEDPERNDLVQAFRLKQLNVLVTTTILERGVTFPSVDVVVIDAGHQVFDEAALVQIAGRAGRASDDPNGEVLFYHDGKTKAIVKAIESIKLMNRRGGF